MKKTAAAGLVEKTGGSASSVDRGLLTPDRSRRYTGFDQADIDRVSQARKHLAAFQAFVDAVNGGDDARIVITSEQLPPHYPEMTPEQTMRLRQAHHRVIVEPQMLRDAALRDLEEAIQCNDDKEILRIVNEAAVHSVDLTKGEHRARIVLARERIQALVELRMAIDTDDDSAIVNHYRPILNKCGNVSDQERERLRLAEQRTRHPAPGADINCSR